MFEQCKIKRKNKVYLSYKYRIYPTKRQKEIFEETIETCRRVYNEALLERRENWEKEKLLPKEYRHTLNFVEQVKALTEKRKRNRWLQRVEAQVLNNVFNRVRKAYEDFTCSLKENIPHGIPRLRKRDEYQSFTYPSMKKGRFGKVINERVFLSTRIGEVKIRYHREIPEEGKIRTVTVKRKLEKWFIIYQVEFERPEQKANIETALGLDFGLTALVTLSTGQQVDNPAYIIQAYHKLKKTITRYQRKEPHSNNRRKATMTFLKIKEKVQQQRDNYRHTVAKEIVKSADIIFYEGLHFFNLGKNTHMNIHISEAGWGTIARFLEYKAQLEGKLVFPVPPQGTSQDCSECGIKVPKRVEVKIHKCPNCGLEIDRDVNASRNVLKRGIKLYGHLMTTPEELRERACLSSLERDAMRQEVGHHGEG